MHMGSIMHTDAACDFFTSKPILLKVGTKIIPPPAPSMPFIKPANRQAMYDQTFFSNKYISLNQSNKDINQFNPFFKQNKNPA